MESLKKESLVVGKVELNLRPMRVKIYEIQDELNMIRNSVWKRIHSKELQDKIKKVQKKINEL